MSEDRKASAGLEEEAPAPEIDFPEGSGLTSDEKFAMYDPYSSSVMFLLAHILFLLTQLSL